MVLGLDRYSFPWLSRLYGASPLAFEWSVAQTREIPKKGLKGHLAMRRLLHRVRESERNRPLTDAWVVRGFGNRERKIMKR